VVALNGQLPSRTPLLRWPDVRHFPVFIGHGIANPMIPLPTAKADFRLLFTAGLSVQFQTYATTHRIHTDMLRDMNRWIMSLVNG
jgi:predicted esterase